VTELRLEQGSPVGLLIGRRYIMPRKAMRVCLTIAGIGLVLSAAYFVLVSTAEDWARPVRMMGFGVMIVFGALGLVCWVLSELWAQ
jgi:hypothetical protein